MPKLRARARRLAKLSSSERYDSIQILQRDFQFNLAAEVRHGFEGQPVRRAFIARARNYLLTSALKPDHSWVLWLDVDVVRYDPDILMDLMSIDKDIVVPNTLWHLEDNWDFWGFDRNNFAETEESLRLLAKLGPDVALVEGYRELATHRLHLVDMPTHLGLASVPLDGIGCTFTLVKAQVHREGVMFPTYVFENQVSCGLGGLLAMSVRVCSSQSDCRPTGRNRGIRTYGQEGRILGRGRTRDTSLSRVQWVSREESLGVEMGKKYYKGHCKLPERSCISLAIRWN